jgi:hypothetical protein
MGKCFGFSYKHEKYCADVDKGVWTNEEAAKAFPGYIQEPVKHGCPLPCRQIYYTTR